MTTNTQNMCGKNGHNNSKLAQSRILFYMYQWHKISDHSTQYEENSSRHHGGMCEDALTDGRTDRLDPFLYSLIPLRRSRESSMGSEFNRFLKANYYKLLTLFPYIMNNL